MLGDKKVTFRFSLNWLLLIFGAAVALIGLFIWGPESWHSSLIFAAAVFAAAAGMTSAANALDSRGSQAEQAKAHAEQATIQAAIASIDRWNSPTFYHCKKNCAAVMEYFKAHTNVEEQKKFLEEHPEYRANLVDVLNHFEALSIGIARSVIHEDTAKQFFRTLVLYYWHTTEVYTKHKRAERQNARLQKEFEALYDRWKN